MLFNTLLKQVSNYDVWYNEHIEHDRNIWLKDFKKNYPNISQGEIERGLYLGLIEHTQEEDVNILSGNKE